MIVIEGGDCGIVYDKKIFYIRKYFEDFKIAVMDLHSRCYIGYSTDDLISDRQRRI
jgi:hypothetical protein